MSPGRHWNSMVRPWLTVGIFERNSLRIGWDEICSSLTITKIRPFNNDPGFGQKTKTKRIKFRFSFALSSSYSVNIWVKLLVSIDHIDKLIVLLCSHQFDNQESIDIVQLIHELSNEKSSFHVRCAADVPYRQSDDIEHNETIFHRLDIRPEPSPSLVDDLACIDK